MNLPLNQIICGDSLNVLKTLPEDSVDSIVTDPPYELGFMGKSWDNTGIANNPKMWAECLRVLKPGGHLLAFGGTRTYHRMACAIEDAGFEVRDMVEWVYGSGFPKSLNIGKAVDKLGGRCLDSEVRSLIKEARCKKGLTMDDLCRLLNLNDTGHGGMVNHWENNRATITLEQFNNLVDVLELGKEPAISNQRSILGTITTNKTVYQNIGGTNVSGEVEITKGTSEWEGWGTALKPAHEPICMARKPLSEKTVAENCLKWGTGGINIDESRVGTEERTYSGMSANKPEVGTFRDDNWVPKDIEITVNGRFPANLILSWEEDRYIMKDNISNEQKEKICTWLQQNL